jgi:hypothetical protein
MRSHPDGGALRRILDDPAGVAEDEHDHVRACDDCRRAIDAMRADAELVHAALAVDIDVDLDAAWQRLTSATAPTPRVVSPPRPSRLRAALRRPAVAGIAVAAVLTGAGTAAANDWFRIFEAERVQPISLSPAAVLESLPELSEFGDVSFDGEPDLRTVPDAAAAEAATGLDVPEVAELPRGVVGSPRFQVGDAVRVTFTYDEDLGGDTPAGLDGSSVQLVAGPGVAEVWSSGGGVPVLLVGRAVAPSAHSSSAVPFEVLRDHLLSLPDLPEELAASLRSFNADGSTFPLPVPAGRVRTTTADVDGNEASVITSRDQTLAAVAWVDDGIVTVVGGALSADELLEVARELR